MPPIWLRHPSSEPRKSNRLQAINLEQRKTIWTDRQRAFQSGGVLAAAGGVVFAAATDRIGPFRVHRADVRNSAADCAQQLDLGVRPT
jgi:hypothetical protein